MQGRRFDRILTGTAIALVLGLGVAAPVSAQSQSAIEALVPLPEPANVPPPTAADVAARDRDHRLDRHQPARSAGPSAADLPGCRGSGRAGSRGRAGDRCDANPRTRAGGARRCRQSGPADPRRAARVRQQQAVAHHRPQAGPHRGRSLLRLARLRADLRPAWTARPIAPGRRSTICAMPTRTAWTRPTIRCRRSRPLRGPAALAEAEIRLTAVRARLCAAGADGPRALFARRRRHHLRADRAAAARRAEQARRGQECRGRPRQLSAAAARL